MNMKISTSNKKKLSEIFSIFDISFQQLFAEDMQSSYEYFMTLAASFFRCFYTFRCFCTYFLIYILHQCIYTHFTLYFMWFNATWCFGVDDYSSFNRKALHLIWYVQMIYSFNIAAQSINIKSNDDTAYT